MSSSRLNESQFSCPICLQWLKDPVTIPCGHSYCMRCLTDHWDRLVVCSCPQCRATFSPRPTLGRNNLLVEMMEKLGAMNLNLSGGPSAPPLSAVLMGPAETGGFQHATFDVSSVRPERNDAERLLGETRRCVAAQLQEREFEVQQLKQSLRSFSRLAKAAVKDSSKIFSELLEFLERRRVETKELIRAQEKAEAIRAENHLQHLERQITELRRRDGELEMLSRSEDQQLIAQMCQSLQSPKESNSLRVSPHVSFGPVRSVISDLKEQLQSFFQTQYTGVTSADASSDSSCVPALNSRDDLLQYFCPLSVDPFTVHSDLSLAEGNRGVRRTGKPQSYPDHPDRFDTWGQALCREGLRGRCYWEAECDGLQVALGLSYESIGRKGSSNQSRLGHNSVSWGLSCSSSSFSFCHADQSHAVASPPPAASSSSSSSSSSRRIGVFLDHDAGLLCFYAVTPGGVHLLHRVETKFDQPLYAAVWLGADSSVAFVVPN
ncbi:E3 ubiquitin/ISG15 ligase TRIM25-like isoform X2 [Mugil cephalus]|uniref:E3 ubiquitin/ISG15 ligase TRIM25-like isoform X2 n=1 Tax=Mugil cephalus TaxID=48193 RepID=UPI001FB7C3D6|nr:E3 ubiquitin/ISG15 ligase TRIM25-like isoform X2 [Mugil cephalus]